MEVRVALLATLTLFVATMGPFGTYAEGNFPDRLVYWTVSIALSVLIARGLIAVQRRHFSKVRTIWRETMLCVGMTAFYTPVLTVWTHLFFPGARDLPPAISTLAVYVLAICACISVLRHGVPYWVALHYGLERKEDKAPEPPRLLDRLEPEKRAPVQRLSVDGHTVIVVMDGKEAKLRMRFGDAVQEMEVVDGFLTHRSHWVAASAVKTVRIGAKGRPEVVLKSGDVVPVSRKHEAALQERGLF